MGVLIHHLPTAHLHQAQMPEIVSFDHGRLLNGHEWMLRKLANKVSDNLKNLQMETDVSPGNMTLL